MEIRVESFSAGARRLIRTGLAGFVVFGVAGCNPFEPQVEEVGVVRDAELCWIIVAGKTRYQPVNLPDAFRTDGLAASFVGHPRDDLMSTCMIGRLIEISSIHIR